MSITTILMGVIAQQNPETYIPVDTSFETPSKAFDFTDYSKVMIGFQRNNFINKANDGWAFYCDFQYDGGNNRFLLGGNINQGHTVRFNDGRLSVSDFIAYRNGSTTGLSAGRYKVFVNYNGTTLKAWIRPENGSTSLEININVNFTASRSGEFHLGGSFNSYPALHGVDDKVYKIAYWTDGISDSEGLSLLDGSKTIYTVSPSPYIAPDPEKGGRDLFQNVQMTKSFGIPTIISKPVGMSSIDNVRILKDPVTCEPVQYDIGSGLRYWAISQEITNTGIKLLEGTDLTTWSVHSTLFNGDATQIRSSEFLYLGNISGSHPAFALYAIAENISGESQVYCHVSNDLNTWTTNWSIPVFGSTSLSSNGIEDFTICYFNGEWLATYEHDLVQTGTVAIGLAANTDTLPTTTGWVEVNSQAIKEDAELNNNNLFEANPSCLVQNGIFYCFYECADFTSDSITLPSTFLQTSVNPKVKDSFNQWGQVFFHGGRKCFPNCSLIENGEINVYMQGGTGALASDGTDLTKVMFNLDYLLAD